MSSHWQSYPRHWSLIKPPLRPHGDVIARVRELVGPSPAAVLLLGVTPELANTFETVHAVDRSPAMIASVWPGDSRGKTASEGDWLDLEGPEQGFDAVVGDGSVSALTSLGDIARLLAIVVRLLKPGGRFACRVYERPAVPFDMADLLLSSSTRGAMNFHAFKWQLAMHIAAHTSSTVGVEQIGRRFNALFPDREALAQRTGWPREEIDTIDIYAGSTLAYSFPDREEVRRALPPGIAGVEFQACGDYDLAHCCPVLTFTRA